jgi:hypothetical protein
LHTKGGSLPDSPKRQIGVDFTVIQGFRKGTKQQMKNLMFCLLAGLCLHEATAQAAHPAGAVASQITLTESVKRVVFGQPLTLTAVVTPAAATGPVTFYADSTTFLGIADLSGGRAHFNTQLLSTGSHQLSAYYAGDAIYAPSTSAKVVGSVIALPESGLQAPVSYNVGNAPYAIALADFNGDGKMDIVAACAGGPDGSTISILLGNGDGTFASALNSSTTPEFAQAVVTGDFNGDGKVDIAVDNGSVTGTPAVSVLLGNGDGTFQTPIMYPLGTYLEGITAGDINGDGIEDLVVSNDANGVGAGNVEILLGNGDGTFQPPIILSADFSPEYAVIADFNGDGKADIAVPNYSSSDISILLGNGDGTFQPAVNYSSGGPQPETIVVADFNGDGKLDIAAANAYGYAAGVLLGNGDGTFQSPITYPVSGVSFLLGIAADDINGDGFEDLIVTSETAVSVLFGNGDGAFQPAVEYSGGNFLLGVALGDFNSDGRADIAFASIRQNTVGILLGLPLPANTTTTIKASPNPSTYLQTVTLTGYVFPPLATGTIAFRDGSTLIGSAPMTAGQATFTIPTLAPGSHSLRAIYGGDANDLTSTSAPVILTVNKIATTAAVTSSMNPSTFGHSVTFTASVSPTAATGTVSFYADSVLLGTRTISGGTATYTTSTLSAGTHSITVTYSGDADYLTSTSPPLSQTVELEPTATKLTASPNPATYGQAVTFTAKVTPTAAPGTVTFYDSSAVLGTATLSGGTAALTVSTLSAGGHTITAVYGGNNNFASSTSAPLTENVKRVATATVLTTTPNPSNAGQNVTLTASVSPATATGRVIFYDGSTAIASHALSGGAAVFNTTALASGTHSLTAVYNGDANDAPSTSPTVSQVVQ